MIDPATLTPEQHAGHACVLCGFPIDVTTAVRVGLLDGHYVHRCPHHRADELPHLVLDRSISAHRPVSVPAGARHHQVAS